MIAAASFLCSAHGGNVGCRGSGARCRSAAWTLEHCFQCLGQAPQDVRRGDLDVFDAARLEVVEHLHSELGALGHGDPQPKDVPRAFNADAELRYAALLRSTQRIEEQHQVHHLQRVLLLGPYFRLVVEAGEATLVARVSGSTTARSCNRGQAVDPGSAARPRSVSSSYSCRCACCQPARACLGGTPDGGTVRPRIR